MKKIISILGSLSLCASSATLTSNVVSCNSIEMRNPEKIWYNLSQYDENSKDNNNLAYMAQSFIYNYAKSKFPNYAGLIGIFWPSLFKTGKISFSGKDLVNLGFVPETYVQAFLNYFKSMESGSINNLFNNYVYNNALIFGLIWHYSHAQVIQDIQNMLSGKSMSMKSILKNIIAQIPDDGIKSFNTSMESFQYQVFEMVTIKEQNNKEFTKEVAATNKFKVVVAMPRTKTLTENFTLIGEKETPDIPYEASKLTRVEITYGKEKFNLDLSLNLDYWSKWHIS